MGRCTNQTFNGHCVTECFCRAVNLCKSRTDRFITSPKNTNWLPAPVKCSAAAAIFSYCHHKAPHPASILKSQQRAIPPAMSGTQNKLTHFSCIILKKEENILTQGVWMVGQKQGGDNTVQLAQTFRVAGAREGFTACRSALIGLGLFPMQD